VRKRKCNNNENLSTDGASNLGSLANFDPRDGDKDSEFNPE